MGLYTEYLDKLDIDGVHAERKAQLKRIGQLRGGRVVLSYAADLNAQFKAQLASIDYSDIQLFKDQLANLSGNALDLLIETPGGNGEIAEQIVRMVRDKFTDVAFIIAGVAKSAGTIMAMSADEILMGPSSALGPIDAQIIRDGKRFSAHALITRFEKVQKQVKETGKLDMTYVPMLQRLSLGELEDAQRSLDFAGELVKEWLVKYKFKNWDRHTSSGQPVTPDEKIVRADEIAKTLCDHGKWKTHGRSIMVSDLKSMGLRITYYADHADLFDAIERYHTLLLMTFSMTSVYKIIETPDSQVVRFIAPPAQLPPTLLPGPGKPGGADFARVEIECNKCHTKHSLQGNFVPGLSLPSDVIPFPADNKFRCTNCGTEFDIAQLRFQIELQTKKKILPPEGKP